MFETVRSSALARCSIFSRRLSGMLIVIEVVSSCIAATDICRHTASQEINDKKLFLFFLTSRRLGVRTQEKRACFYYGMLNVANMKPRNHDRAANKTTISLAAPKILKEGLMALAKQDNRTLSNFLCLELDQILDKAAKENLEASEKIEERGGKKITGAIGNLANRKRAVG